MSNYVTIAIRYQLLDLSVDDNGNVTILGQRPMTGEDSTAAAGCGHAFGLSPTVVERAAPIPATTWRLGAVVVFDRGVLKEQAEAVLDDLANRGLVELRSCSSVEEFHEELGGPVWYVP